MKIAIVCGHLIPELGYFEVHLAKALSRLGHSVRVITSVKVPSYVTGLTHLSYKVGRSITPEPAFSIERLPAFVSAGQMALSFGVKKAVDHFTPDLIFVIGLGKIFPKPVFEMEEYNEKTYTFLGDNEQSFSNGSLSTSLVRKFLKKPVYQKAIERSKGLFAYTRSTEKIVAEQVGSTLAQAVKKKLVQTTLGFDGTVFKYDPEIRAKKREEIKLEDNFTWICVSRISTNKDFEPFLMGLAKLKDAKIRFKAIFVGAEDSGAEKLLARVQLLDIEAHITILPFQKHNDLNALYNAADAAWYPMAAISNFEGLGTGLPVLLPNDHSVSHILTAKDQGAYYDKENTSSLMLEWSERLAVDRKQNADQALGTYEYQSIVGRIIDQCQQI